MARPKKATHGLLLVSGATERIRMWLRRGLVPGSLAPLGDWWTGIVPDGPHSAAQPPYDDAIAVLFNRPIPWRLRPALGFFADRDRAFIMVCPKRIRATQHWIVWQSGVGLVPPEPLPRATLSSILQAADCPDGWTVRRFRETLREPTGTPMEFLSDVFEVLDLPGFDSLSGRRALADQQGSVHVDPDARRVHAFDDMVADDAANEAEVRTARARPLGEETAVERAQEEG